MRFRLSLSLTLLFLVTGLASPVWGETTATDWFYTGMMLYDDGKFNESIQAYDKSIQQDPLNEEAWNGKGMDLGSIGRYDEALRAFEKATEINSSYAEGWFNIGVILDMQGKIVEAIQAYNTATQINPSYQKALVNKNRDIDIVMSRSLSCACPNQLPMV